MTGLALEPSVVRVPLTQGLYALIDATDWPLVAPYTWSAYKDTNTYYAQTHVQVGGKSTTMLMHRLIAGVPDDVDHADGNGLDNRRRNLRQATVSQNQGNSRIQKNNTSGFKGVGWHKRHKKYQVQIEVNGKPTHLGYFADPVQAAHTYDEAARLHFGQFAAVNFPQPGERSARAA